MATLGLVDGPQCDWRKRNDLLAEFGNSGGDDHAMNWRLWATQVFGLKLHQDLVDAQLAKFLDVDGRFSHDLCNLFREHLLSECDSLCCRARGMRNHHGLWSELCATGRQQLQLVCTQAYRQ